MMIKTALIRIGMLAGVICIFLPLSGLIAQERGDLNQAIKLYTKAINSGDLPRSKLADIIYTRGNLFLMMTEYDRVIEDASKALELAPKGKTAAYAYYIRATALSNIGQLDGAIKDHNKSIDLKPDYVDGYYGRGLTWIKFGDKNRALADFTKAITLNPEYAVVYCNRGNVWMEKGDLDRALSDYNKAIELDPTDASAYYNRGNFYIKKGDYDLAINDSKKAIELNPKDSEAYYNIGTARLMKKSYNRAISNLTKAILLNPNYADAYFNRCIAYARSNQPDESLSDAKRFLEIAPNHPRAPTIEEIVRKSEFKMRYNIVKDKMMLWVGIVILLIGSIFRGWFILNQRRLPGDKPPFFCSEINTSVVAICSLLTGIIGSILIGLDTTYWIGIITLVGFWVLSGLWSPILESFGL